MPSSALHRSNAECVDMEKPTSYSVSSDARSAKRYCRPGLCSGLLQTAISAEAQARVSS